MEHLRLTVCLTCSIFSWLSGVCSAEDSLIWCSLFFAGNHVSVEHQVAKCVLQDLRGEESLLGHPCSVMKHVGNYRTLRRHRNHLASIDPVPIHSNGVIRIWTGAFPPIVQFRRLFALRRIHAKTVWEVVTHCRSAVAMQI